jgi:hypothetical protein
MIVFTAVICWTSLSRTCRNKRRISLQVRYLIGDYHFIHLASAQFSKHSSNTTSFPHFHSVPHTAEKLHGPDVKSFAGSSHGARSVFKSDAGATSSPFAPTATTSAKDVGGGAASSNPNAADSAGHLTAVTTADIPTRTRRLAPLFKHTSEGSRQDIPPDSDSDESDESSNHSGWESDSASEMDELTAADMQQLDADTVHGTFATS